MPSTKKEKMLFSLLMPAFMVYGMEIYNKILIEKTLEVQHFFPRLNEFILLMAVVIALETLIGGPLARKGARRITKASAKPITAVIIIQICTVCVMCPMMSMVVTIIFKCGFTSEILSTWLKTVAVSFPMALFWQLLIAGPLVRFFVLHTPKKKDVLEQNQQEVIISAES